MRLVTIIRKSLGSGSITANVLEHATSAFNIDGCRLPSPDMDLTPRVYTRKNHLEGDLREGASLGMYRPGTVSEIRPSSLGRWPANLIWHIARQLPPAKAGGLDEDSGIPTRFFKQIQRKGNGMSTTIPQELWDYLYTMIAPPPTCDPVILVEADLSRLDWSQYKDQSVHGMITMGDPTPYLLEIDRVLKPGAHLLLISDETDLTGATGACAVEDFGYEIRDAIAVMDTPGEFHYVAKASKSERNAGVPEFETTVVQEKYFPTVTGDALKNLQEELAEVIEPQKWRSGLNLEDFPDPEFLEMFELRKITTTKKSRNSHPTVKPTAIMERLMQGLPEGAIIVDPFMGSGSTGIAALKQGLNFIGIEQDADYLKIAHHRIHHADRSNAAWDAADIRSDFKEETAPAKPKSLTDFFGL